MTIYLKYIIIYSLYLQSKQYFSGKSPRWDISKNVIYLCLVISLEADIMNCHYWHELCEDSPEILSLRKQKTAYDLEEDEGE